jgi:hypothetical protein
MNHIITGDERNVKNLETQVYVSWGLSFKDGQISSPKVNLKHTLLSADNGRLHKALTIRTANCQLYIYLTLITSTFFYFCSEETSKGCAVRRSPYIVVTPITNIQKGELSAATRRPPLAKGQN